MITLRIADPRLALWLCSNPMRHKGTSIAVVAGGTNLTIVVPWVIHPEAWNR